MGEGDKRNVTNRMFYCAGEDEKRTTDTISITKRNRVLYFEYSNTLRTFHALRVYYCTSSSTLLSQTLHTLHALSFRTIDWSPHTTAAPPAFADRNGTRPRVLFPRCRLLLLPPPPLLLLLLPLLPLPPSL